MRRKRTIGPDLIEAMGDALAYVRGERGDARVHVINTQAASFRREPPSPGNGCKSQKAHRRKF